MFRSKFGGAKNSAIGDAEFKRPTRSENSSLRYLGLYVRSADYTWQKKVIFESSIFDELRQKQTFFGNFQLFGKSPSTKF